MNKHMEFMKQLHKQHATRILNGMDVQLSRELNTLALNNYMKAWNDLESIDSDSYEALCDTKEFWSKV